ncbi:MAG: hypothetical protein OXC40_01700, partial [Proteobacteria bacterium]|nr:hypothetical protein [Pseudomonadota bacterium]
LASKMAKDKNNVLNMHRSFLDALAQASNKKWRPVGLGMMGLQDVFFKLKLPFDSDRARELSRRIAEEVYFHVLSASCDLAKKFGAHENFKETRAAKGNLQFDLWQVKPSQDMLPKWQKLKAEIKKHGLRNSLTVAIAPTATIASIAGVYECIEPQISNLFKRETLSGEFLQVNNYLVAELRARGLWNREVKNQIKSHNGSLQSLALISDEIKAIYRTAWEIPQKSLIEMAADRGAFIDQSQSLNLFIEAPTIGKLSSMYIYAWKQGLKTTYYLRSRGATQIRKTTIDSDSNGKALVGAQQDHDSQSSPSGKQTHSELNNTKNTAEMSGDNQDGSEGGSDQTLVDDAVILNCSLENPGSCEACT